MGRWVDDIYFGVSSVPDAKRKLGRFQEALDSIGLYPNISKTRWYTRTEYEDEYHAKENDELGEIESYLDDDLPDIARQALDEVVPRLLSLGRRGRGWDRALRRVCTFARQARSEVLLGPLPGLLWERPTAGRHLLKYRASCVLDRAAANALISTYKSESGVYDDIDALVLELLAVMPVDPSAAAAVATFAKSVLKDRVWAPPRGLLLQRPSAYRKRCRTPTWRSSLIGRGRFCPRVMTPYRLGRWPPFFSLVCATRM